MLFEHIQKWIDYLSYPQDLLKGLAICPFAKKAKFQIIKTKSSEIIPPSDKFEIIIYNVEDNITFNDLYNVCKRLNREYPDLIFLPDHKERKTFIKTLATGNGKFNLVLCQRRDQLEQAREMLRKTDYYKYWSPEYLKEIMEM